MDSEDYVVKLVIGVKNGYTYYDHSLTKTEKRVHFKKSKIYANDGAAAPLPCRGGAGVGSVYI